MDGEALGFGDGGEFAEPKGVGVDAVIGADGAFGDG